MIQNNRSRKILERDYSIWSRQSGISWRYQIPKAWLVWEWLFSGNGNDTSGNGNNLTLVDAPTYQTAWTGYFSQEWNFNGSSDYATLASNSSIEFTNAFSYSIIWKWSDTDAMVLAKRPSWNPVEFSVYLGGTADFRVIQWVSAWWSNAFAMWWAGDFNTLQDWWYHTLSFSHQFWTTNSAWYLDWKPISLTWTLQTNANASSTNTLYIGKNWPTSNSFPQWVLGVRLWNRVLSPKEHMDIHLHNLRLAH